MKHLETDQLSQLLEGSCQPPSAEIETHLETCSQCQQTLSNLAAQQDEWNHAMEFLSSDDWNVDDDFQSTERPTQIQIETDGEPRPAVVPLTFLDDARHPELLGRLGKYDIESVIGQGGMGVVLKGFDPDLNRPVAIKVMAPWLATSGTARKRFAREAQAAAAVVHEHVVAIHGIETDSELPYLVMEFVGGESLQQYIDRNGPLETNEILRIATQVASGLAAAHEQGLVHRDVKPANILLHSHIGRVQITDFGLARAADDAAMTFSGIIAGTPQYMSPEQASGHGIDVRSDLFSLGSTIYLMATGRLPFRASGPMAVLNQICNDTPDPIRGLNPEISQHLSDIVSRLLVKDPDQRFQSAEDVEAATRSYLAYRQHPLKNAKPARIRVRNAASQLPRRMLFALASVALLAAAWFGFFSPILNSPQPTTTDSSASDDANRTAAIQTNTAVSTNANSMGTANLQLMPLEQFDNQLQQITDQLDQLRETSEPNAMFEDEWNVRVFDLDSELNQMEAAVLSPPQRQTQPQPQSSPTLLRQPQHN